VECEEQIDILRDLRCDIIQGYLWGGPQPASRIPDLLSSGVAEPCIPGFNLGAADGPEGRQQSIS
jgi:hypothetical protein